MANSADPHQSQLIWIYIVYKGRIYPGSARQGLNPKIVRFDTVVYTYAVGYKIFSQMDSMKIWLLNFWVTLDILRNYCNLESSFDFVSDVFQIEVVHFIVIE